MKKLLPILLAFAVLLGFAAYQKQKAETLKPMSIAPAVLTDRENELISLVSDDTPYLMNYDVDERAKSMSVTVWNLDENAEWKEAGGIQVGVNDTVSGLLAFSVNRENQQFRIATPSGTYKQTDFPPIDSEGLMQGSSSLSEGVPIVYDTEIPLILAVYSKGDGMSVYDVSYFNKPEELAKQQYDYVSAVTVNFSVHELP